MFGRDKFYRPTFVQDYGRVAELAVSSPELLTNDNCLETFMFIYEYIKNVCSLPGQLETWPVILDLRGLGIASLPREQMLSLGGFIQYNIMYHLDRSYCI